MTCERKTDVPGASLARKDDEEISSDLVDKKKASDYFSLGAPNFSSAKILIHNGLIIRLLRPSLWFVDTSIRQVIRRLAISGDRNGLDAGE